MKIKKFLKLCGLLLQGLLPRLYFPAINRYSFTLQGYTIAKSVRISSKARLSGAIKIQIGDGTYIGDNTVITGGMASIHIGNNCDVSDNVLICSGSHLIGDSTRRAGIGVGYPIIIGDGVWIGIGSIILPGVTIGEGSIIAAGSVVIKNVPPNCLVAGNPAVFKKEL